MSWRLCGGFANVQWLRLVVLLERAVLTPDETAGCDAQNGSLIAIEKRGVLPVNLLDTSADTKNLK